MTSLLMAAAKVALFLLVAFYVGRELLRRLETVDWEELHFDPWLVLLSALCLVLMLTMQTVMWRQLSRSVSHTLSWRGAMAMWLPQMGKYVPGKTATVLGAFWVLVRFGLPRRSAAAVVFVRTGIVILVGLIVAAPLTLWGDVREALPLGWLWCTLLVVTGGVLLHPRVFAAVGNFVLRKLRRPPIESLPRLSHYAGPVIASAAQWVFAGTSLYLLARGLGPMDLDRLGILISAAALSVTFGFLAFFAPAGLGVREGLLLAILVPMIQDRAAVVVLAWRALQILTEVTLAGVGLACIRYGPHHQEAGPSTPLPSDPGDP